FAQLLSKNEHSRRLLLDVWPRSSVSACCRTRCEVCRGVDVLLRRVAEFDEVIKKTADQEYIVKVRESLQFVFRRDLLDSSLSAGHEWNNFATANGDHDKNR